MDHRNQEKGSLERKKMKEKMKNRRKFIMSFSKFEGTQVISMDWDGESAVRIRYTAKLDKGSATVFYDMDGEKKEWFRIKAGEAVEAANLTMEKGSVDILVETQEPCEDGTFTFDLEE